MRKTLGVLVLILGVGGLGWYATKNDAVRIQKAVTAQANAAVSTSVHGLSTVVMGRDITVTGTADTEAERTQILAALGNVVGHRVVTDELEVLPVGAPFVFKAQKSETATRYSGLVPSETDRAKLGAVLGSDAQKLVMKSGAPAGWSDLVLQNLAALDPLERGTLSMSDQSVRLTGLAKTPKERAAAEAAFAKLPSGFSKSIEVDVLDDGTPLRLNVTTTRNEVATGFGKFPKGLDVSEVSNLVTPGGFNGTVTSSALPAENPDWGRAAKIGAEALGALDNGQLTIEGNVVNLSGEGTPDGVARAKTLLAGLPASIARTSDLGFSDDGKPFSLLVDYSGRTATASGKFPAGLSRNEVARTIGVSIQSSDIFEAHIDDTTGVWPSVMTSGVTALKGLERGQLSIIDRAVKLSGVAMTPADGAAATAHLDNLPEGFTLETDIGFIDDGTPPAFKIDYIAATGATVEGKLPKGTTPAAIANALRLSSVTGDTIEGLTGSSDDDLDKLALLSTSLPDVDRMTIQSNAEGYDVQAFVAPSKEPAEIEARLLAALGSGATVSILTNPDLPADGTERTNFATGRTEIYRGGYWLTGSDFVANAQTCTDQGSTALENNKINFLSGSAQVDEASLLSIETITVIILKCVTEGNFKVEIGGHTDSQGSAASNLDLSQERANALRTELINRGVPADLITAQGYGEVEPIADNDTAEGRAANRRTTLAFSQ